MVEQVPAPKSMIAIEGADHFFQGRLDEVQSHYCEFRAYPHSVKGECRTREGTTERP